MSSKIEQLIDEIEEYIDTCKYQPLSKTNIVPVLIFRTSSWLAMVWIMIRGTAIFPISAS